MKDAVLFEIKTNLKHFNTLTTEIEENFSNEFSVLTYDNNGDVFKEKFAKTFEEAKEVAQKMHFKTVKQF